MFAAKSIDPSSIPRMGLVEPSDLHVCTHPHTFMGVERAQGLRAFTVLTEALGYQVAHSCL